MSANAIPETAEWSPILRDTDEVVLAVKRWLASSGIVDYPPTMPRLIAYYARKQNAALTAENAQLRERVEKLTKEWYAQKALYDGVFDDREALLVERDSLQRRVEALEKRFEEADRIGDMLSHALDSKNESVIELQEELERVKKGSTTLDNLEKMQGYNV